MRDFIINALCLILVLAIIIGALAKLFSLLRGIVLAVINLPHTARASLAELKEALRQRKIISTKTDRKTADKSAP
jgi:hypothetical protein